MNDLTVGLFIDEVISGGVMDESSLEHHGIKTRRRGTEFAKEHGIDAVQYIDEKGRRLKNFQPRF